MEGLIKREKAMLLDQSLRFWNEAMIVIRRQFAAGLDGQDFSVAVFEQFDAHGSPSLACL